MSVSTPVNWPLAPGCSRSCWSRNWLSVTARAGTVAVAAQVDGIRGHLELRHALRKSFVAAAVLEVTARTTSGQIVPELRIAHVRGSVQPDWACATGSKLPSRRCNNLIPRE